jgi:rubrerythrin
MTAVSAVAVAEISNAVGVIAAQPRTRRRFVQGAVGVAIAAGTATFDWPKAAAATPSQAQDRRILTFALQLEHEMAAFYEAALRAGRLRGELRRFAEVAAAHEREHVKALRDALGIHAPAVPRFSFGREVADPRRFTAAAIELEEAAVGAYNGQAANLTPAALAPALEIVSVDARHAAWIRSIANEPPAPRAADPARGAASVAATYRRIARR